MLELYRIVIRLFGLTSGTRATDQREQESGMALVERLLQPDEC